MSKCNKSVPVSAQSLQRVYIGKLLSVMDWCNFGSQWWSRILQLILLRQPMVEPYFATNIAAAASRKAVTCNTYYFATNGGVAFYN